MGLLHQGLSTGKSWANGGSKKQKKRRKARR